MAQLLY